MARRATNRRERHGTHILRLSRRSHRKAPIVIVMPAILDPLPNVARHVMEANAFGLNEPTGAVCLLSYWLPQPSQAAFALPMSSPQ